MSKRHRSTDDLGEEEVTHPAKKRTYPATRETKSFKPPRLPGVRAFDAKRGFRELYRRNTKTVCSREQQIIELQQTFHGEKADTADVVDIADRQWELVGKIDADITDMRKLIRYAKGTCSSTNIFFVAPAQESMLLKCATYNFAKRTLEVNTSFLSIPQT